MLVVAAGAQAQRFLDLGPRLDDPVAAEQGLEAFAVGVDIDMLRTAPQQLALPTPDGRVLVAELSVFEERGNGDLMWAGGFAEAGFESVTLTVRDGHFAGRFGEPGGAAFRISSGPTGRGRLVDASRMRRNPKRTYCPGGIPREEHGVVLPLNAASVDRSLGATAESNDNSLDVLVVYSSRANEFWGRHQLTPESASQLAIDYLNMVLRNGRLNVSARLVHVEPAPASVEETEGDGACGPALARLRESRRVARFRAEHEADLVHFFLTHAEATTCGGLAFLLERPYTARDFSPFGYALTNIEAFPHEETFAHEMGHNLGLHHVPETFKDDLTFEEVRRSAITPYAFGHEGFGPSPFETVMGGGRTRRVPWFSTVREEPMEWKLGVRDERESERALREVGLVMGVQYSDFLPGRAEPPPLPPGWRPYAPSGLGAVRRTATTVRLAWVDNAQHEDGFLVEKRRPGQNWREAKRLPRNTEAVDIDGLVAGGRYDFRVFSYNENGRSDFVGNVVTVSLEQLEYTDCVPSGAQIRFAHGYAVSMCVEYLADGVGPLVMADAEDYGLESQESGILYFFDRDNAEVLVKVLDACAVNGYRWVFVAPVTDLAFNLYVDETATGTRWTHRNPKGGQTASTKSDTAAFPCGASTLPAARAEGGEGLRGVDLVASGFRTAPEVPGPSPPILSMVRRAGTVAQPIGVGQATDCEPQPVLNLAGGYRVSMCYETGAGKIADALDWRLDSRQSALLYFFDRNNAEVLIKVLDACGVNGHRWVFVAPVTDLAFNLSVESPDGEVWTHRGFLGLTASAKSDTEAFACR